MMPPGRATYNQAFGDCVHSGVYCKLYACGFRAELKRQFCWDRMYGKNLHDLQQRQADFLQVINIIFHQHVLDFQ